MKLNSKVTNTSSTEEFALTDSELETVLGGQGWGCTPPPCDGGGSPNYGGGYPNYGGGSPNYGGGSSCGGGYPNYGGGYSPNGSPSDGGVMYSITTSTTTYYMGNPTPSGSSCGGGY